MAVVARQPHLAVEVVNLEVQRLGVAPMRVIESAGEEGFTARASLDRDGVTAEGQSCFDTSKKRASQRAVVSLLAVLVGVSAPVAAGPAGVSGPGSGSSRVSARRFAVAASADDGPASVPVAPAMSPAELEAWLDYAVGQPEPDPEFADQLISGRLTPRSLYLLLFEARAQGWACHRATAWDSLLATPSQAPGVLSMHTQARSWPPAAYVELREGTATAYVTTPDGPVVGEPAVAAAGIRAARASAALALVRNLAPPVEADGGPAGPAPGGNPVGLLNERAQIGVIADLTYTQDAAGPAHRPVFTCTASCVHATDRYVGTAEDTSKNAAKARRGAPRPPLRRAAELHGRDLRLGAGSRLTRRAPTRAARRRPALRAGWRRSSRSNSSAPSDTRSRSRSWCSSSPTSAARHGPTASSAPPTPRASSSARRSSVAGPIAAVAGRCCSPARPARWSAWLLFLARVLAADAPAREPRRRDDHPAAAGGLRGARDRWPHRRQHLRRQCLRRGPHPGRARCSPRRVRPHGHGGFARVRGRSGDRRPARRDRLGQRAPVAAAAAISGVATLLVPRPGEPRRPLPGGSRGRSPRSRGCSGSSIAAAIAAATRAPRAVWRRPIVVALLVATFVLFLSFNFFYVAFPVHAATALGWDAGAMGAVLRGAVGRR